MPGRVVRPVTRVVHSNTCVVHPVTRDRRPRTGKRKVGALTTRTTRETRRPQGRVVRYPPMVRK
ncbi:hypothetical protein DMH03_23795 [Amycolatopsis sp. WAC 01376]|nr:hypothetical protein DMH03_23795 [Amycolatopsis sp. WAC 01376]